MARLVLGLSESLANDPRAARESWALRLNDAFTALSNLDDVELADLTAITVKVAPDRTIPLATEDDLAPSETMSAS